jgi:hypothetical protein
VKPPAVENLSQLYAASAERIFDTYRTSSDPWLYDFDWPKAEICLDRAVQLGAGDDRTLAKLALVRGYGTLERLNGAQYSDKAAEKLRLKARDEFMLASHKTPAEPAPHLALARVYVYSLPDPEKAMAEFATAEKLGATLGRREVEQQGDAYRIRAQEEFESDWRRAIQDAETARGFYRRVPGFDEADHHLRELERIHAPAPRKAKPRRSNWWR